jgi:hypothetical protein
MRPARRRTALVLVAAIAMLVAAASTSRPADAPAAARRIGLLRLPPAAPAGENVLYGHIESLARKGRGFELRFDPAWLLQGTTAYHAAVEDKVIPPGEAVPNDNYTRDETHRLLIYLVPVTARVTVVTTAGTRGLTATTISVPELAQILRGRNPRHRPLFDRQNGLSYWIRVATDTVRSLDQQYHP